MQQTHSVSLCGRLGICCLHSHCRRQFLPIHRYYSVCMEAVLSREPNATCQCCSIRLAYIPGPAHNQCPTCRRWSSWNKRQYSNWWLTRCWLWGCSTRRTVRCRASHCELLWNSPPRTALHIGTHWFGTKYEKVKKRFSISEFRLSPGRYAKTW